MQIMKFIRGAMIVLALAVGSIQCAHAADDMPTVDNTAGVLILQVDDNILGFVFISKTGMSAPVNYRACAQSAPCKTVLGAMLKVNRATIVTMPSGCKEPTTFLPTKY